MVEGGVMEVRGERRRGWPVEKRVALREVVEQRGGGRVRG